MNGAEQQIEKRQVKIKVIRYGTITVPDSSSDSELVFDLETMQYSELEKYLEKDFDVEVI